MNRFAKLLDQHMRQCGTSERKMANLTGFSRAYISMMRSGKRCSPNYEQIRCLILNLNLTPKEEKEITDAYWQQQMGKDDIEVYDEIKELIESVFNVGIAGDCHYEHQIGMPQRITGETSVMQYARIILENQKDALVRVVVPGYHEEFCRMMGQVLRANRSLRVEHIFSMDKEISSRGKNNIRILKNIFLNAITGLRYMPYFYYVKQQSCDSNSLFPYCLITEKYIMIISEDWTNAYLTSDPYLLSSYLQQYQVKRTQCQPLLEYVTNRKSMLGYLADFLKKDGEEEAPVIVLESAPCFVPFISKEIIQSAQKNVNPALRKEAGNYLKTAVPQCYQKGIKNYFSMEGLQRFVTTGEITIVPPEYYRPFSPEERLEILENYLTAVKNQLADARMIHTKYLRIPEGFGIYANEEGNVAILYRDAHSNVVFRINDKFSRNLLYEYLKHLDEGKYTYDRDRMLSFLEKMIGDLRKEKQKEGMKPHQMAELLYSESIGAVYEYKKQDIT